jgi:hypothetical protein
LPSRRIISNRARASLASMAVLRALCAGADSCRGAQGHSFFPNVSESLRACALIHMRALTRSARGSCLGTGRYTAPIRMAPTKVSPARATPDARIRSITLVAPDPEGAQTRSQRHWLPWHSTQCGNILLIDQRESHCAIRLSHRIVNKPRAAPPESSARSLRSADRERARTADGHGECRPRPTWCPRCRIGAATGSFEIKAGKCRHRALTMMALKSTTAIRMPAAPYRAD